MYLIEFLKMKRYLIGPEIIWILIYLALIFPAKMNWKISTSFDNFLETIWFWMPVLALLTFALWWVPSVVKNWLLLRAWISCLVGGLYIFEKTMYTYGKTGPGIGAGYLASALMIFFALVIGTITVKIKFR